VKFLNGARAKWEKGSSGRIVGERYNCV
jgi:hypothetical protein